MVQIHEKRLREREIVPYESHPPLAYSLFLFFTWLLYPVLWLLYETRTRGFSEDSYSRMMAV
ncbi:hypothetical protein EBZ80_05470 [bacterium]|nr:hypothetical protein [bacterium]